jgi:hypothetical protein
VSENKDTFLEKMHRHLFADRDELPQVFDAREREVIIRFRAAFTKWMEEPSLRDVQIIHFLCQEYGISESQAYRDIPRIKLLIGNVKSAGKEFQRYRATEMILKGYEIARDAVEGVEVKQAMAMIRAGEALVKVHKLDKDEIEGIQWEDIIPLELEPSTDISVIGRKKVEDLEALKEKLRKKYGVQPVEDATFTELTNDSEEESLL